MLSDKKYGLSVNIMATRVMPSLLPQTVNPSLNLEQFTILLEVRRKRARPTEDGATCERSAFIVARISNEFFIRIKPQLIIAFMTYVHDYRTRFLDPNAADARRTMERFVSTRFPGRQNLNHLHVRHVDVANWRLGPLTRAQQKS